jgi:hypothetical protein
MGSSPRSGMETCRANGHAGAFWSAEQGGGAHSEQVMKMDDDEPVALVRCEVGPFLPWRTLAPPSRR